MFSKAELLRDVWGYHRESRTRTLDSHACRLRNKLAAAGARRHVVNVWGVGYRLLDPVTAPERNGAASARRLCRHVGPGGPTSCGSFGR